MIGTGLLVRNAEAGAPAVCRHTKRHPLLVIVVVINGGCFIVKLLGRR